MCNSKRNWLLAVVVLFCLAPAALAKDKPCAAPGCKDRKTVPEGGSTAIYLLGAGLTSFGAMYLRSRLAKPTQS
jgi:hypothetical protein